jgi:hypothetical protein
MPATERKQLWTIILAALVWTTGFAPVVHADDEAARQLVAKASDRYRSVKTERETLEVLVIALPQKPGFSVDDAKAMVRDGGRGVTHKRAVRSAVYTDDRRDQLHVLFSLPPEDEGTGFLVWRQPGSGEDSQWLYMPALQRVRRVPVSSTATFVGTNLIYEDVRELAGENVDRYVYTSAGTETVDGVLCDVVAAVAAAGRSSAYGSRKVWIDPQRLTTMQIEYYDDNKKILKVLRNSAFTEVKKGVHRPALTEVRDLGLNEATLIWTSGREVGVDIPAQVFTRDYLENP